MAKSVAQRRKGATALVQFAVIVGIVVVMITPWVVRNWLVAGQFVFLDTRTGFNLYMGFNEHATGGFNFESAEEMNRMVDDTARHNFGMAGAKKFIREHPWRAAALIPRKFAYFWDLDKREFIAAYSSNYIGELHAIPLFGLFALLMLPFPLLTLSAVLGAAFSRYTKPVTLVLLFIAFYTAMTSLILADSRLHMGLIPFLAILAAQGLYAAPTLLGQLRTSDPKTRRNARLRAAAACAVMLVFMGIWIQSFYMDLPRFKIIFGPGGNQTYLLY